MGVIKLRISFFSLFAIFSLIAFMITNFTKDKRNLSQAAENSFASCPCDLP